MKKTLLILMIALLTGVTSFAQLTGAKRIGTGGDYSSIAAAIVDLNASGVGAGGVTFNVDSNYTETASNLLITATGTSGNPILFQKKGTGTNPLITASTGVSTTLDGIIVLRGSDYITFDGIDLAENAANTTATTRMEFGYALLKNSGTDGSQYVTIKNCTINLNKTYISTVGIYSNNHTPAAITALTVTAASGANSYNKFYGNIIGNCFQGIYLQGSSTATYYDQYNEIGKDKDVANSITNVGGGTANLVAPYNNASASGIYTVYQNNLKVVNNTITSTMAGTKTVYGIFLTTANNANLGFFGNTVTLNFSPTDGTNAAFNGIYCDMGGSGTTNTVNIYNNTVTNCTYPTLVGAQVYGMYLLNLGVNGNVYGNLVSNNTFGSGTVAATGQIAYMRITKTSTTAGPLMIHHNSITGNSRVQSVVGGGLTYFIWVAGSGTTHSFYNNIVNNNVVASNGGTQCMYLGFTDAVSKSIYNNSVTNISQANGSVNGMYMFNGKLAHVFRNTIQNISASSTANTASLTGLYISNTPPTNSYYYNNVISQLSCPASVSSQGTSYNTLNGIYVDGSTNFRGIYYNTVYLDATTTVTSPNNFGSSAFCAYSLVGVDLRNNSFVNMSAAAGTEGKSVALRARNTSFMNFTSNYNNLYAGAPSVEHQLFWNGTVGGSTLVDYRALVTPNELQSVSELPPFVNVSTNPYNLHLQTGVPTQCEAGGIVMTTPIAINVDYDSIARFPNAGYPAGSFTPNAPDLGADEIGGTPNDVTPPAIIYTPIAFTSSLLPRTMTATITDGSLVPTTGNGLPVLYWKINSGAYQAAQATWVSGSTYSFTFGGGVAYHDIVYYYIAAQDSATAKNVGTLPWQGASGFTSNPPACSTPPTNPSFYYVLQDISGIKHVGVGKDYETLTAAAADLNDRYMSATVTFILDDNTYPSETYPILFNANPGNSAVNRLVIKPNTGATPVLSGSVNGSGIIIMNGIDFVTFNGSNAGLKDQSLTLENTAAYGNSYVFGITNNGGTDPSKNITLKNCVIKGNNARSITETYGVVFNGNGGINGGGYDSCVIDNNTIKRAKYGIYVLASASRVNKKVVISNNIIGAPDQPNYIRRYGIAVEQSDSTLITGNEIMGPAVADTIDQMFGVGYFAGSTNTKITKNKIHDWIGLGLGSFGIKCSSDNSTAPTEISNNLIYNIGCSGMNSGPSNNNAYGIFARQGGNIRIWYNTIYLSGPYLYGVDEYAPSSACICFYDNPSNINIDLRNNILRNSMTNPAVIPGGYGKAYGIQMSGTASMFLANSLNNNDYYIDGYLGQIAQQFSQTVQTDFPTLASWQTYTGQEANSMTFNPEFISDVAPVDLHSTNVSLNCAGKFITGQPSTDYANSSRKNPPDPGAYEFQYTVSDYHTLAATAIGSTTATLNGDINTLGEVVEIYLTYGTTTAYGSYGNPTGLGSPPKIRCTALTNFSAPITGLTPNTLYHVRIEGYPATNGQAPIYGNDITFTTLPLAPAVVTTSSSSITYTGATLNGTVNANGGSAVVSFEYGLTTGYGNSVAATPSPVTGASVTPVTAALTSLQPGTLYHFRAMATNAGGTTYGSDLTFTTPVQNTQLTIKVFPEGLFNGIDGLNPVQECTDGENTSNKFTGNIADTISVLLAQATAPFAFLYEYHGLNLLADGTITTQIPGSISAEYYIAVIHRNSVEVWSAQPISFSNHSISVDFTVDSLMVYGGNEKGISGSSGKKFVLWGGEVTSFIDNERDGYIDGFDVAAIFNRSQQYDFGYKPYDVTGDGFVDGFDVAIVFNNSQAYAGINTPQHPLRPIHTKNPEIKD